MNKPIILYTSNNSAARSLALKLSQLYQSGALIDLSPVEMEAFRNDIEFLPAPVDGDQLTKWKALADHIMGLIAEHDRRN
jgi:hypothetical protein